LRQKTHLNNPYITPYTESLRTWRRKKPASGAEMVSDTAFLAYLKEGVSCGEKDEYRTNPRTTNTNFSKYVRL
jgi:hypothetical protein